MFNPPEFVKKQLHKSNTEIHLYKGDSLFFLIKVSYTHPKQTQTTTNSS